MKKLMLAVMIVASSFAFATEYLSVTLTAGSYEDALSMANQEIAKIQAGTSEKANQQMRQYCGRVSKGRWVEATGVSINETYKYKNGQLYPVFKAHVGFKVKNCRIGDD